METNSGGVSQDVVAVHTSETVAQGGILNDFLSFYLHPGVTVGLMIELAILGLFMLAFLKWRKSGFMVFFEMFFEKIYEFFEDILGKEEKRWTKMYITLLFFIILFSNLLGVFIELLLPIFGDELHHLVTIPTADINFNVAMAVIGVVIVIYEQFKFLGFWKAIYEYVPVGGKNYIPFEKGKLPKVIDIPVFLLVKAFDIVISVFLGLLEIVGHGAKIISLSFRLFGNVTSGGILLGMLILAVNGATNNLIGFEFPVLAPIILYLQELLVAFIQALVFPLLVAIFIKVAKVH